MDNHMALANNAWATRQNYLRGLSDLMLHLDKRPEDCIVRGSVPTNTIIEKSIQSFFPQTNARGG